MDKLQQWVALTLVGALAVLAAGWFLLVSPKRADAAALRAQAQEQASNNATLETQLVTLKAKAKDLPRQQAKLAAVSAKIPDVRAMPALIRALTKAAADADVELVSLTPGATAAGTATAGAAPVAPVAGAPAAGAAGAGGAAGPAGQLASVPLTINVVGGFFQVEQFMSGVENLPRALRVSNLAMVPGTNPVKPGAAVTAASAASAAPAGSAGSVDSGRVLSATVTGQVFVATGRSAPAAVQLGRPTSAAPTPVPAK